MGLPHSLFSLPQSVLTMSRYACRVQITDMGAYKRTGFPDHPSLQLRSLPGILQEVLQAAGSVLV